MFCATASDPGVILGERLAENLGLELGSKVVFTMTDRTGEIVGGLPARLWVRPGGLLVRMPV